MTMRMRSGVEKRLRVLCVKLAQINSKRNEALDKIEKCLGIEGLSVYEFLDDEITTDSDSEHVFNAIRKSYSRWIIEGEIEDLKSQLEDLSQKEDNS